MWSKNEWFQFDVYQWTMVNLLSKRGELLPAWSISLQIISIKNLFGICYLIKLYLI